MILHSIAAWLLGVALASSASPKSAAPLSLRLQDDQGAQIRDSLRVCLHRELETFCLEQPPYEVPSKMKDFDVLTAEGPSHGPIEIIRSSLPSIDTGELSVKVPRKASLDIQGLTSDAVALSLYPGDDDAFRKPAFRFEHLQATGLRIPARRFVLALSDGQHAPDLQLLDVKPGAKYSVTYHQRPGWSLLFRSLGAENTRVKGADAVLVSAALPGKERELAKATTDDQ